MEQIKYNGQIIEFDRQATQDVYKRIEKGRPECCSCGYCLNFVSGRKYYPHDFLEFLGQIGIDCKKESEVWCLDPVEKGGLYFYHGWFNFIGSIVKEPQADLVKKINPVSSEIQFACSFSYCTDLAHEEFKELKKAGMSIASVDFEITIPWLLEIGND